MTLPTNKHLNDLLIPLPLLQGLDWAGLEVRSIPGPLLKEITATILPRDHDAPAAVFYETGGRLNWSELCFYAEHWNIDLSNRYTRDRVAVWMARQIDYPLESSSPIWAPIYTRNDSTRGTWSLFNGKGVAAIFVVDRRGGQNSLTPSIRIPVPLLNALDVHDDTRLPDGSRWVDARAMALSAATLHSRFFLGKSPTGRDLEPPDPRLRRS